MAAYRVRSDHPTSSRSAQMKNNHPPVNSPPRKKARRTEADSQCAACVRLFSQSSLSKLNAKGLAHLTRHQCAASIKKGCVLLIFPCLSVNFEESQLIDEHEQYRKYSPILVCPWRAILQHGGDNAVYKSSLSCEI